MITIEYQYIGSTNIWDREFKTFHEFKSFVDAVKPFLTFCRDIETKRSYL